MDNEIEEEGYYYWSTEESHCNNSVTMDDFILNELPEKYSEVRNDGTYSEIINNETNEVFSVDVSGDGDFNNHKAKFTKLITET